MYAHFPGSVEDHLNLLGIGAWRNGEVIFQVSAVGVKDEVDALVDTRNFDSAVLRDVIYEALEISTVEIVTHAPSRLSAGYVAPGPAARKPHSDSVVRDVERGWCSRQPRGGGLQARFVRDYDGGAFAVKQYLIGGALTQEFYL